MAKISKYKYEISTDKEPTKFKIYKCTNLINEKIYIGQTVVKFENRISSHINNGIKNKGAFSKALQKHGLHNFKWEIIDYAKDSEELNVLEIYYIQKYNSLVGDKHGYNISIGGGSYNGDLTKSASSLELQSKALKKRYQIRENREKRSIDLGSKPFNVYKNPTGEFVGSWINKVLCAMDLNINKGIVKSCLSNKSQKNDDYIFIYEHDDTEDNRKSKTGLKPNKNYKKFNVYDRYGKFVMDGLNHAECAKSLNILRASLSKCLQNKLNSYKGYIFIYADNDTEETRSEKLLKMKKLNNKPFNVYKTNGEFVMQYTDKKECAELLNLYSTHISDCLNGRQIKHKGYKFYYIENDPNLTNQKD